METTLKKWQRSLIRNSMAQYRHALDHYYIKNKRVVKTKGGEAFSLLSPTLGSAAARRRIRYIMNDALNRNEATTQGGGNSWGNRTPHFITIAVTYDCQCDCHHCSAAMYREKVKKNKSGLTLSEIKDAVKQAIDMGTTCVIFTGGEPLLFDNIYELIESVDQSRSICTIFTNGESLNENTVNALADAGTFGVFVSLDYAEAERHNLYRRRKGIFEKALRGIIRCQERGILTGISTFASKEKIESGELDTMMDLAKKLNVLEVFVFDIIATGKLDRQRQCMLGETEVEAIRAFRRKYNAEPDYPRIIHQTMFTSIAYPCAAEGCPAAVAQMHLRGNGDVTPCDFTPLSFGNIRDNPLKEIWQEMITSDIYSQPSQRCRLSSPEMWARIDESQGEFGWKNKAMRSCVAGG